MWDKYGDCEHINLIVNDGEGEITYVIYSREFEELQGHSDQGWEVVGGQSAWSVSGLKYPRL